jgi:hypothetical protein
MRWKGCFEGERETLRHSHRATPGGGTPDAHQPCPRRTTGIYPTLVEPKTRRIG